MCGSRPVLFVEGLVPGASQRALEERKQGCTGLSIGAPGRPDRSLAATQCSEHLRKSGERWISVRLPPPARLGEMFSAAQTTPQKP
jgi:hypothetical protein